MKVAEAVGRALAAAGVRQVFGVVGSGNFHVTNALVAGGARFVAARHEGGAATMADAFSRVSRTVAVVSLHQGCGLTNAMTGIAEAAKSRTPLLVVVAETAASAVRSNFRVDQAALAVAVDAESMRIRSPSSAVDDALAALLRARDARRTIVLNLPLDVQAAPWPGDPASLADVRLPPPPVPAEPAPGDVRRLADAIANAERPVFIAGRGACVARAREPLELLADRAGALIATSAVAKGMFHGSPFCLDVSGGFASPLAAELIASADLVVAWGCALNMWTTRHGRLIAKGTRVAQIDVDVSAIGAHHAMQPNDVGVVGDVATTARAVIAELVSRAASSDPMSRGASVEVVSRGATWRTPELASRIAASIRWRDVPFDDDSEGGEDARIDPRALTIALDDALPKERIVAVDSGNFMGYPSMYLSVPDEDGFCFTQAFQSIGLGLATAIGAALARPDRLPVAALGDGGAMMSIAELDTVVRLKLPMAIVVYDDDAYGAEVHHFGPHGAPLDIVRFPETDIAAIGRGFGCDAITVRRVADLAGLKSWLAGRRDRPILVQAKVTSKRASWWLEEAFRGH